MIKGISKIAVGVVAGSVLTGSLLTATNYETKKGSIDTTRGQIESSIETIRGKINSINGIHSQDKQTLIAQIEKIHQELESNKNQNTELSSEVERLTEQLELANKSIGQANTDQTNIDTELKGTKGKIESFIEGIQVPQAIEIP